MIEVGIMPFKQYFKVECREDARERNESFNCVVVYFSVYDVTHL